MKIDELTLPGRVYIYGFRHSFSIYNIAKGPLSIPLPGANGANGVPKWGRKLRINASCLQDTHTVRSTPPPPFRSSAYML